MVHLGERSMPASAAMCMPMEAIKLNHFHINGALGLPGGCRVIKYSLAKQQCNPDLSGATTGFASVTRPRCRRQHGRVP